MEIPPRLSLFADPEPPDRSGIDLVRGDVAHAARLRPELAFGDTRADLVIADPPWTYRNQENGAAARHYDLATVAEIADHVAQAFELAAADARLALWVTFPLLAEWMAQQHRHPWQYVTGGAWVKPGQPGAGYHWRGNAEAVLVYRKGRPGRPGALAKSGHVQARTEHSAKPIGWQAAWIAAWTRPGDLVLDLYAGLGTVAEAALGSGREYLGFELDADRHQAAIARVAQARPLPLWSDSRLTL